jgi:hypothetical protein
LIRLSRYADIIAAITIFADDISSSTFRHFADAARIIADYAFFGFISLSIELRLRFFAFRLPQS